MYKTGIETGHFCTGATVCPIFVPSCSAGSTVPVWSEVGVFVWCKYELQSPTLLYKPGAIKVCCHDKLPQSRSLHFNYAARSLPVVLKLRSAIGLCWPVVHGSYSKSSFARLLSGIIELTVSLTHFIGKPSGLQNINVSWYHCKRKHKYLYCDLSQRCVFCRHTKFAAMRGLEITLKLGLLWAHLCRFSNYLILTYWRLRKCCFVFWTLLFSRCLNYLNLPYFITLPYFTVINLTLP